MTALDVGSATVGGTHAIWRDADGECKGEPRQQRRGMLAGVKAAGLSIVLVLLGCASRASQPPPAGASRPDGDTEEEWPEDEPGATAPAEPPPDRDPPRATPTPRSPSGLPADMQALLDSHNRVRTQHCAPPLGWSTKLAASAQAWADALRGKNCAFEHSRTKFGENLAAGSPGALDAEGVTAMWYEEIDQYNFKRPGFSMATGHFTQVVWRQTSLLGCGKSTCSNGMEIWVCQYDPPGNIHSQFPANVSPRGCK